MSKDSALLSIVIPVYNEQEVLPLLRDRLIQIFSKIEEEVEVVLVDDGSKDNTAQMIRDLAHNDRRFRSVLLSRNYGHQIALTAGLAHARGDVVVVLDADLQDPPELIPAMLEKWRAGYDVVYGKRIQRRGDSLAKRATAAVFYWTIRALSGMDIPENVGDFRLMDRKVVEALKNMPERFRFVRGLVSWVGFKQTPIEFERPERAAGETKYPWSKMFRFAFDAIFAFSVTPLRLALYLGLTITGLGLVLILRILYLRYVTNTIIPGFSATFVAIWLLGGLNLSFLGIFGEYIGRIYVETKGRPLYLVQELASYTGPAATEAVFSELREIGSSRLTNNAPAADYKSSIRVKRVGIPSPLKIKAGESEELVSLPRRTHEET